MKNINQYIFFIFAGFFASISYSKEEIFAVIDLPPFGCSISKENICINTELTRLAVSILNGSEDEIIVFPYPRALSMFKNKKTAVLVALENNELLKIAASHKLYSVEFYLLSLNRANVEHRASIAYLRGSDVLASIAEITCATKYEVNNYEMMINMIGSGRLDYVIVPKIVYDKDIVDYFKNAKIISSHFIYVYLYTHIADEATLKYLRARLSLRAEEIIKKQDASL
jgi:hypothetical protein